MPYFKTPSNAVHFLDDPKFANLLPVGATAITDTEAQALQNPAVSASDARAAKITAVKAERDRRIQAGGYKVGTKWYHSDTFSRTQQMGLVMSGANIPAGLLWKTMDGTFVPMTALLAQQIFAAAAASDPAIFTAAEMHIAAINASTSPSTYNVLTGWPLAYGE